jgi:Secretory lipase
MKMMYDVDGYMGYHGVPRMPVFVYKAVHDQLSKVADTDALVARFCGVGANILYHRNTAGGHNQELANGRQRAFAWLRSVLDGSYDQVYSAMGCTVVNVTYDLTPNVPWD